MNASAAVMFVFAASHEAPCCPRSDGHAWNVRVSIGGEINYRTGMVTDIQVFAKTCMQICNELHGTDLNQMLPGVTTTPEGVASYIHERLVMTFPISRVAVEMRPGYAVELEWPRR